MGNFVTKKFGAALGLAMMCGALFALCSSLTAAPPILNYQATLSDADGKPLSGTVVLTFTFWDASSGGNQFSGFLDTDVVTPGPDGLCLSDVGDDPGDPIPETIFATDMVWLNVNANGTDILPRTRMTAAAYALSAFSVYGEAYAIPQVGTLAGVNSTNLFVAYDRASSLRPHGQPLSATNRAAVLIPPGQYDFGAGGFYLGSNYVDLIGISTAREDQHFFGNPGPGSGLLEQVANDVHIENLFVECTRSAGGLAGDSSDPAAYFPNGIDATTPTVVRNCLFKADNVNALSMRRAWPYAGTYIDCTAGDWSFGGAGSSEGVFLGCFGGKDSFGGRNLAIGTYKNCSGGDEAFGGGVNGNSGFATGEFTDCIAGNGSFGAFNTASGKFTRCRGGSDSFAGSHGIASGSFSYCNGGSSAFGGNGGRASGTFMHCVAGINAFGSAGDAPGGKLYYCAGGTGSFTTVGSPVVKYCAIGSVAYP